MVQKHPPKWYTIATLSCGCRAHAIYKNGRCVNAFVRRAPGCDRKHTFLRALLHHWRLRHDTEWRRSNG